VSILTSRQWPPKRRDILSRLQSVLGESAQTIAPLEPQVLSEEDMGGYLLQKVRYQVEPGEFCPAWLLLPKPLSHRQPAVLCCHQTVPQGKDEPAGLEGQRGLAVAKELVTRGYVCLAPDSITAGERAYPGVGSYETAPFYELNPGWSALGKMLWDHQRALDFLCVLDAVDSDRLGVIGHSLGGENAIMLGAFDHRVKVTAASCAYTPFAVDPTPERWCRDSWFVYLPRLRGYIAEGKHPPFTWVEVLALLAPRAFHYSYALGDECFPHGEAVAEDMVKLGRLYDLLGCRQKFAPHQDPGEHRYPRPAREAAYRMLKAVLVEGRGG
jgi:dienelactone hydrolase